jgi:hypothetical protein
MQFCRANEEYYNIVYIFRRVTVVIIIIYGDTTPQQIVLTLNKDHTE